MIMNNNYTVMVILEAKPGKEIELKQALHEVAIASRNEKTCLGYRLHQDVNSSTKFILYETWQSKETHQLQFEKPYLLSLFKKLDYLLNKPYEAYFAEEII